MKKLLFTLFISFFVLAGCSGSNVKTQPSITLPYEITNHEVPEYKEEGLDYYTDYQVLEKVTVRDLTADENEKFLELIENNTLNTLNSEYSAVEFYFGDSEVMYNEKGILQFDKSASYFVYDDEILNQSFYQLKEFDSRTSLNKLDDNQSEFIYGRKLENFKIITLVEKEFIKKGLQFKTTINDEIIYIDID